MKRPHALLVLLLAGLTFSIADAADRTWNLTSIQVIPSAPGRPSANPTPQPFIRVQSTITLQNGALEVAWQRTASDGSAPTTSLDCSQPFRAIDTVAPGAPVPGSAIDASWVVITAHTPFCPSNPQSVSLAVPAGSESMARATAVEVACAIGLNASMEATTLSAVQADTPALAQQQGISGEVTILVTLDEQSNLVSASVEKSPSSLLNLAALNSARASRFHTPVKDCKPIPGSFRFIVGFSSR